MNDNAMPYIIERILNKNVKFQKPKLIDFEYHLKSYKIAPWQLGTGVLISYNLFVITPKAEATGRLRRSIFKISKIQFRTLGGILKFFLYHKNPPIDDYHY